jgi:8-oxo-dGTP pyrophosphatase MutT (NUDIX family)
VTEPSAADSASSEWHVLSRRTVYDSPWIQLGLADVVLPSGQRFQHHTVSMPAAAMSVVLDDAGANVLLSWRHRFVPDLWNWELPGGLVDGGEGPQETAMREIEEETGYRVRKLTPLVVFEPMVGMVSSPHHVFLGRGVEKVAEPTELDEGRFEWVSLDRIPELIRSGQIRNSGTLVGLLHYLALGGGE